MEVIEKIEVPPLMTVPTLAKLTLQPGESLAAKKRSIRRMCTDKTIRAARIGDQWYIPRDVLLGDVLAPVSVSAGDDGRGLVDALNEWMRSGTAILTSVKEAV